MRWKSQSVFLLVWLCAHIALSGVVQAQAPDVASEAADTAEPSETSRQESSSGPAQVLNTRFSSNEFILGEPFEVQISAPEGFSIEQLPSAEASIFEPFVLLEGQWEEPENGSPEWRGQFTLFDLGSFEFPVWTLSNDPLIETEGATLNVVGALPEEEVQNLESLADIKAPASIAPNWTPWIWAGAILGLLFIAAGLWFKFRKRLTEPFRAVEIVADPFDTLAPHEWAYREIKALLATEWAETGQYDAFYTRLSWITRRYLGGRYRLELMERTTSEIPPALKSAGVSASISREAYEFLTSLDFVKFAKQQASVDACKAAIETCYQLIDRSKPKVAEASQEPQSQEAQ